MIFNGIHKVKDNKDDLKFKPGILKLCLELEIELKYNKSRLTKLDEGIESMSLIKAIYGI